MGLSIKHKNGKWQATSSISGEKLLKKPGSKDDIKKALIQSEIWKFLEKISEIEMDFPHKYTLNGRYYIKKDEMTFNEWWLKNVDNENFDEQIYEKAKEVVKKYDLWEYFEPLKNETEND